MTLSLEQVRQTRFHLARRNGYEPMDVDNFVDKVEVECETLAQVREAVKAADAAQVATFKEREAQAEIGRAHV